jgi:hypothetical protein
MIEKALIDRAEGMFLWVDLMLAELNRKTRASSMLESLNKAPKDLDAMLRRTLETFSSRLNEEEALELNIILTWVTCADQPLRLVDLDDILRLELRKDDERLGLDDTLRTQYASLFVLNREDGLTTADLADWVRQGIDQPQNGRRGADISSASEQRPSIDSSEYAEFISKK